METCRLRTRRKLPSGARAPQAFHYVNLYQSCPRKWYFRYLKGWRNKIVGRPLVLGSAFHEAKADYYKSGSVKKAIETGLGILEESRKEIIADDYEEIGFRIPILVKFWVEEFGKLDRSEYKFLAIEKQWEVPIEGTEYKMTIRPDTVVQSKSNGLVFVMETKTSGFSHRITEEGVAYGDQATAYLFGVKRMTKWEPYAVLPDIAYWNSKSRSLDNIKMIRGDLVFRSDERIRNFEKGVGQLFHEMSAKAEAYRKGFDPWVLFPRNSYYCMSFSTPCEFAEVCGNDCERKGTKVPNGFKRVGGVRKLGGYVEDSIGSS